VLPNLSAPPPAGYRASPTGPAPATRGAVDFGLSCRTGTHNSRSLTPPRKPATGRSGRRAPTVAPRPSLAAWFHQNGLVGYRCDSEFPHPRPGAVPARGFGPAALAQTTDGAGQGSSAAMKKFSRSPVMFTERRSELASRPELRCPRSRHSANSPRRATVPRGRATPIRSARASPDSSSYITSLECGDWL